MTIKEWEERHSSKVVLTYTCIEGGVVVLFKYMFFDDYGVALDNTIITITTNKHEAEFRYHLECGK